MFKSKVYNILIIVSFLLLLSVVIYSSCDYIKIRNRQIKSDIKVKEECKKGNYETEDRKEFCKSVLAKKDKEEDFFMTFTNIVIFGDANNGIGLQKLAPIIILFLIIPVIYFVSRYLKSGIINYHLTREKFSKIKQKLFLNAYKPVLILPCIVLIAMLISYFYAPHFNGAESASESFIAWSISTVSNPLIFILLYIFNVIVHSFLFVNIALCVLRKYNNFFAATVLSYLIFIATEVFLEIAFGGILFTSILKMPNNMLMFNIMNMFAFNDANGILSPIIVPFILMLLSFVLVLLLYKDKEKMIIDFKDNKQKEVV